MKPTFEDYKRTREAIVATIADPKVQDKLGRRLLAYVNGDIKTPYQTLFTSANVMGAASTLNNLQSIFDYEHRMILASLEETRRDLLVQNEISP